MDDNEHLEEIIEPWWKGPIKYFLAIVLIFIIILWYFPSQAVKLDPEPKNIPTLKSIAPTNITIDTPAGYYSKNEYLQLLKPNDPVIKQTADRIVTASCNGNKICYAKAIYYFLKNNFQYVSDPNQYDYVKSAKESLITAGGDCDDASVLAANLLQAVGINTRFVFIPGHVYIQAYLPDALKKYKTDGSDYVNLDLTCVSCEFGQIPYSNYKENKVFVG